MYNWHGIYIYIVCRTTPMTLHDNPATCCVGTSAQTLPVHHVCCPPVQGCRTQRATPHPHIRTSMCQRATLFANDHPSCTLPHTAQRLVPTINDMLCKPQHTLQLGWVRASSVPQTFRSWDYSVSPVTSKQPSSTVQAVCSHAATLNADQGA